MQSVCNKRVEMDIECMSDQVFGYISGWFCVYVRERYLSIACLSKFFSWCIFQLDFGHCRPSNVKFRCICQIDGVSWSFSSSMLAQTCPFQSSCILTVYVLSNKRKDWRWHCLHARIILSSQIGVLMTSGPGAELFHIGRVKFLLAGRGYWDYGPMKACDFCQLTFQISNVKYSTTTLM